MIFSYNEGSSRLVSLNLTVTKKQKKEVQQKKWGMSVNGQIPMVLVEDGAESHIQRILQEIVEGIAAIGIQLVVIEPRNDLELKAWRNFENLYPHAIKVLERSELNGHVFDIEVLEEVTAEKLQELAEKKIVPMAEKGLVQAFDPIAEKGNGFVFEENSWSLFAALVRAAETYRFPYDWQNVVKAVGKGV